MDKLMHLIGEVWNDGRVPQDLVDTVLIQIPKKGISANVTNGVVSPCSTSSES